MAAGEDERQPTLEAPSFGERVLWRPGRALVIGNPERCRELLEGLAVFAWHEGHLRRLTTPRRPGSRPRPMSN